MNSQFLNHQDTKTPRGFEDISAHLDQIGKEVVDCAFVIHKEMGPGLLESIYQECFQIALAKKNIPFESQKSIFLNFMGEKVKDPLKPDLIVANSIIIELKSVDKMNPVYEAQLISYMKLSKCRLGYLINFNVPLIKDGISRRAL